MAVSQTLQKNAIFTLTDLLVCIAIVIFLAVILLPTISAAREQAKMIICKRNLQQIGTAIMKYAHDNDDAVVPALANTYGFANPSKIFGNVMWQNYLVGLGYTGAPTGKPGEPDFQGGIFYCPQGVLEARGTLPTSRDDPNGMKGTEGVIDWKHYYTWYGMNAKTYPARPRQYFSRMVNFINGLDMTVNKISELPTPARIVAVYDGSMIQMWNTDTAGIFNVSARHFGKLTNTLFADGHAESIETAVLAPDDTVFGGSTNGIYLWVVDDQPDRP